MRGADLVARTLQTLGVRHVFALSGNHIMPIFDALLDTSIDLIHVRHEAACVHMADAWGRLTGEVGVALVTGGPGHANATPALFTALAAESPMVLLSGHAGLSELDRGAFQEMAQADLARPLAKASWVVADAKSLPQEIARAFEIARSGRPGPVHLSLPFDVLEADVDGPGVAGIVARPSPSPPSDQNVAALLAHVAKAERPLIVLGPAHCTEEGRGAMRRLEAALGAPVVGMESPRGVNDPGLGAFADVLARADLLVLLGKPLDFTLKFGCSPAIAKTCRVAVVDPDPALIARVEAALKDRLLLAAVADTRSTLDALIERGERSATSSSWLAFARKAFTRMPAGLVTAKTVEAGRLHSAQMCSAVAAFVDAHPGATFVCDGGEIGQWAQAIVRCDRRIINGVAGSIGAALPFALAAQAARPGTPVLAVMGDGTFGFHMAEFDTAVRHSLPVIVVVGNDACWNAEYQIQLRDYGKARARHCQLLPARYDKVAEALGGFGALVTSEHDLTAAFDAALASGKPSCINVMIESVPAPTIRLSAAELAASDAMMRAGTEKVP